MTEKSLYMSSASGKEAVLSTYETIVEINCCTTEERREWGRSFVQGSALISLRISCATMKDTC